MLPRMVTKETGLHKYILPVDVQEELINGWRSYMGSQHYELHRYGLAYYHQNSEWMSRACGPELAAVYEKAIQAEIRRIKNDRRDDV